MQLIKREKLRQIINTIHKFINDNANKLMIKLNKTNMINITLIMTKVVNSG